MNSHRAKRDVTASVMPDALVMRFPLRSDDVILRLQRVRYPPVYIVREQGMSQLHNLDHANGPSSVYVDPSRSASYMVKQVDNGQYVLDGNLKHEGQQLFMRPSNRRKRSADNNNNNNNNNDNMHVIVAPPQRKVIQFDDGASGEHAKKGKQSANQGVTSRRKRQTTVAQHVIETAFVIDHTDYAA
ncbi:hypothetical protein ACOMHN_022174 [Nucella lapillus]